MTTAYFLGLFWLFDRLNSGAGRVLTYHGVVLTDAKRISGMDVTADTLREQLHRLCARYEVVRLDQVVNVGSGVAVAFDDGNLSDLTRAAPILDSLGVKGAFFVCSDLVSGKRRWTWSDMATVYFLNEELAVSPPESECVGRARGRAAEFELTVRQQKVLNPYDLLSAMGLNEALGTTAQTAVEWDRDRLTPMSGDQVAELAAAGHLIGSHAASHLILSHLVDRPELLEAEVSGSRQSLGAIPGVCASYFSYPFGGERDAGPVVEKAVQRAGYVAGFYNHATGSRDSFRRSRLSPPDSSNAAGLYAVTSGFLHFMKTGKLL